jgi:DNA-binding transcriptional MerR regulator
MTVPVSEPAHPTGALTVAAVARRLGVAPSTLRTWDRRYGLGPVDHPAGSHRRYTPQDLARLIVMRRLTMDGVPPAEAARLALQHEQPAQPPAGLVRGGGRVIPLAASPLRSPATRGLATAASALDTAEVARLLRAGLRAHGIYRMWQELAVPVLVGIGARWEATGDGVDVEHAFCEALLAVLRSERAAPANPVNSRPVLLGCAEGDQHSLALHVLDHALAADGVASRVLGAGMPDAALIDAVRRSGPAAVFLFAELEVLSVRVLTELPRQRPAPRIVVGGAGWRHCALPPGVRRVDTLAGAVCEVLDAVQL